MVRSTVVTCEEIKGGELRERGPVQIGIHLAPSPSPREVSVMTSSGPISQRGRKGQCTRFLQRAFLLLVAVSLSSSSLQGRVMSSAFLSSINNRCRGVYISLLIQGVF